MHTHQAIKTRKTDKVLANESWESSLSSEETEALAAEMLNLAAFAPYHFPACSFYKSDAKPLNSPLPFRFYVLDAATCRAANAFMDKAAINAGKLKNLMDAADLLFVVTWLPDVTSAPGEELEAEPVPFQGTIKNMEHIAAASSAIQNVLLGATAKGIPNYWSSGGALRKKVLRDYLNIPIEEILLGGIFLFPKDCASREGDIKPGKMRDLGKDPATWSTWVKPG